jgi:concanavalin A-like lectin/glucanase superfamily protein
MTVAPKPLPREAMTDRTARRDRGRLVRRLFPAALIAAALALSMGGCVIIEFGSNSSTQLNTIGKVEVSTTFCASDTDSDAIPAYAPCQGSDKGGNSALDASGNPFLWESFTGANGTTLTSHTGEIGATWTKHPTSGAGSIAIDANRAHQTSSTNSFYYASGSPATADYDVEGRLRQVSDAGLMGVTGRMDTSASTMYQFYYDAANNLWGINKWINGVNTSLGTWSETLANGDERSFRLQMRGSSIKGFVDGVERISATDSAISAAGKAGVRGNTASSTTGVHLDWIIGWEPTSVQIQLGYRIPTNATAPSTITTTNPCGGSAFTFSQNSGYTTELTNKSPPGSGKQWVGYMSTVSYDEFNGPQCFKVQPQFTLQQGADGSPFQGPFNYRVVVGVRFVNGTYPASRPVDCGSDLYATNDGAICVDDPTSATVATDLSQDTRDLGVIPTATAVHAGAIASVPFNLKYAGASGSGPFTISASTDVPGATATPSYANAVKADNPLVYWRLGESSGTNAADASGNGRNGTYVGSPTLGAAGALSGDPNTAVSLNGTSQYLSSSYSPFAGGSARTFEGWAYTAASSNQVLFGGTGVHPNEPLMIVYSTGDVLWAATGGNAPFAIWTGPWPGLSQWVHWAVTWDDATGVAELFINGQSKGTITIADAYSSPGNLELGTGRNDQILKWNGRIDDFAVYPSALSASRIGYHYNVGTGQNTLTPAADSDNTWYATVNVPAGTAPGTYHVTVTATLANGQTRSGTADLVVGSNFAFHTAPALPSLGTIALNGQAQAKTAQMNNFSVNDTTGSASGWNVTVVGDSGAGKSNVFKQYCPGPSFCGSHPPGYVSGGYTLSANSLTLNTGGASWTDGTGTTPSFQCNSGCSVDRSAAIKAASAPVGGGTGLWSTSGFSSSSLSLSTPTTLRVLPASEQYHLDVIWTLASGP